METSLPAGLTFANEENSTLLVICTENLWRPNGMQGFSRGPALAPLFSKESRMSTATMSKPVEVLLVEDNPGDVRLTQEALRESLVAVHLSVARDGVEALDFLHKRDTFTNAPRPDLILLDLNLPRKNGREVLSEIKQDPELRRIPVLVMTTSRAEQDIQKAYALNANCYITKPMDLDEFLRVVRTIEEFWFHTATLPSTSRT